MSMLTADSTGKSELGTSRANADSKVLLQL
jgi:hypothetical protein